MDSLLTVIIPTYNRKNDVCMNALYLDKCIRKYNLDEKVKVIISDNHSEDGTFQGLLEIKPQLKSNFEFRIQDSNLGGTFNSRSVLKTVTTPFSMLLGDDDILDEEYLSIVIDYIEKNKDIAAIFPNFHSNISNNCRDDIAEDRIYDKGTKNLEMMFKAHQMSGLVFKTDSVLDTLFAKHGENRYYQVFCLGFNMLRGKTVHITRNPMTVNDTNKKFWSYGNDCLWDDMLLNIRLLDIPNSEIRRLERHYISHYAWSAVPRLLKHPIKFLKAVSGLKNMSASTKALVLPMMFVSCIRIVYQKRIKKVGKVK